MIDVTSRERSRMQERCTTYLAIIGRDVSTTLASTIFKVRLELQDEPGKGLYIVFYDNGSTDSSEWVAQRTNAHVMKYRKEQRIDTIMRKAVDDALSSGARTSIFLDLSGDNDADDAVSLVRAAFIQGAKFAGGWINPRTETGRIGCLALDRKNLEGLSKSHLLLEGFIDNMLSSSEYKKDMYREIVKKRSKLKKEGTLKLNPFTLFRTLRRNHPLKFYGSLGLLSALGAMGTGFYTVDYFYKGQTLYYPTAFATVLLTMIGGFLLVTGLFLNAMSVVEERMRAMRKWESASEGFRW